MMKSAVLSLFTLFVFSIPSAAFADSPCPHTDMFASELEAVVAAMNNYNPISISEDREFMGTIFKRGNRFGYSVTAGSRHRDRVSIRVARDEWESVAAFWHTHGDGHPSNRYFSDNDTDLVNRYRKRLYLGDFTGYLKRFSPGDKTMSAFAARRLGLPQRSGYAIGETVRDVNRRIVRIETRKPKIS